MPRAVDYYCEYGDEDKDPRTPEEIEAGVEKPEPCDFTSEEYISDSYMKEHETPPDSYTEYSGGEVCKKCGGRLVKGLNLKNNCQVWGVNKI